MDTSLKYASSYIELSLKECGHEKCIPDKIFKFTEKNYHLFHYVVAGKGTLTLKNKTYQIHKGMIFYIPPFVSPRYSPDKDDPWTYIWLGFDGSNASDYLKSIGFSEDNPVISFSSPNVKEMFDNVYNEYASKGYLDMTCLGYSYVLLHELIKEKGLEKAVVSTKERHITSAKEYINNNYQFEISVEDIASNVGVTPNYLANIFSQIDKSSPKKYLTKIRMDKAKLLLLTSRYKIKDIALMVGYKNQLHFSSEFKKFVGESPLSFFEKHKKENII